jgi:hypothetical protein
MSTVPATPAETPRRETGEDRSTATPSPFYAAEDASDAQGATRPTTDNLGRSTRRPADARTSGVSLGANDHRVQNQQKMVYSRIQQLERSLWLKDNNYQTWKFYMESIMQSERTWKYTQDASMSAVFSSHHQTTITASEISLSTEMALRAANTIKLNIDPSQVPIIMACNTAYEMWNALKARHEIQSIYRSGMLRDELLEGAKKGESIERFLTRLTSVKNQLIAIGDVVSERDEIIAIMRGLPPVYDSFKMQYNPTMTAATLRSYVLMQKQRLARENETSARTAQSESARVAHATSSKKDRKKKFVKRGVKNPDYLKEVVCYRCNKKDHIQTQ